jgi:hypothetical protein
MNPPQDGHGAAAMLDTARRLAARIGLTPEEQAVAAAGGLLLAEIGVDLLLRQTQRTGRNVRPEVLSGMLAVALDAVWHDEEFNTHGA